MRSTRVKLAIAVAVLGVAVTTTAAVAGGGGKTKAKLSGFQEVPAVLTDGVDGDGSRGQFPTPAGCREELQNPPEMGSALTAAT